MDIPRKKQGTAIVVRSTITDVEGANKTPDSATVTITGPTGVEVVAAGTMTVTLNVVTYIYQIATDAVVGMYVVDVTAVDGSYNSIKEDRKAFEVY